MFLYFVLSCELQFAVHGELERGWLTAGVECLLTLGLVKKPIPELTDCLGG